jgi:hypothetical protein
MRDTRKRGHRVDDRTKREDRSGALGVIHARRDAWRETSELLAKANGYFLTTPRTTSARSPDALPTSLQRLLALSGIAFAVLLVVGFLISGGDTPDYTAADQEWTDWGIATR